MRRLLLLLLLPPFQLLTDPKPPDQALDAASDAQSDQKGDTDCLQNKNKTS